ncbi:ferric reductase-like transmembrane domain-containing protein [Desulfocastanea catecholica]
MVKLTGAPAQKDPADAVKLQVYRILVFGFLLFVLAAALSIPFVYETQTLWYKIGRDKTMLRAAQLAGLLAAVLLFVQILVAARGQFLKRLFGVAALMRRHRTNGILVSLLALGHAILVLAPEGLTNLPIGKKHWPEMVGMVLLTIVLSMAISAHFREKLALDYKRWRAIHKLLGYMTMPLLAVHVLFVCESFEHAVPRFGLIFLLFGVAGAVGISKKAIRQTKREQKQ